MSSYSQDELLRVSSVEPFYRLVEDSSTGIRTYVVGLSLSLENGDEFTLVNIPVDVAEAIRIINEDEIPPRRQSLYTFLANHEDFKELMRRSLKRVVIDEFDEDTGLYTATVEFGDGQSTISVKMIPSQAIFLALITDRPVYVHRRLVEMEKRWGREGEGEGEEEK